MARIVLVMPELPQKMGAPYLGQQYVAASLVAAGHEVKCVDAAATQFRGTTEDVEEIVANFGPDIIGFSLFTANALAGYRLAARLRPMARLLVAGGPHATVCQAEPLKYGFDVTIAGEAEVAIRSYAEWVDTGGELPLVAGATIRTGDTILMGSKREFIEDLDTLPFPQLSYACFEADHYGSSTLVIPGGMMTSRGCPARCTFCANYVTGRRFRWRSAANVCDEMGQLVNRYGTRHFSFWDDAFTANRPRLNALCEEMSVRPNLKGISWSCITPANMTSPRDLAVMWDSGCRVINFGVESGDADVLKSIQKGQNPRRVKQAVVAAKEVGMTTIVNFMFGFPGETAQQLDQTLAFMADLSQHTDYFNQYGVLVPYPGTHIYQQTHQAYGFHNWWLDPDKIPAYDPGASPSMEHDPALDIDFFNYPDGVKLKIAECVRFKVRHNQRHIERLSKAGT